MTIWSKPSHKFAATTQEKPSENFRLGIDLSLGQLIEMRHKSIIQWLAPQSKVKTNRIGGFRSKFKGRGMDFDESRLYQIGDDIRNIDWKVTARTGDAHTKLFKEERERPVFVVLDQMPSMFFGTTQAFKSIVASKVAAQLMWSTLTDGDRFGALLFGVNHHLEMKPSSNRRNCMRLLNRIVETHQKNLNDIFNTKINVTENNDAPKNQLSNTLQRLQFLAKPGTLVHIISDFNQFDDQCQKQLSRLSQHIDVHCVLIKDPIESQLPPAGFYGITDGIKEGFLNTANRALRNDYQQAFAIKEETIKDFTLSHKGIYTSVDTNFQQQSIYQHQPIGHQKISTSQADRITNPNASYSASGGKVK